MLLIPADQAGSFDPATAGGRQVMVVVPYDQYEAAIQANPSASNNASASSSLPAFDQRHVLLLVPVDQLQHFSQLPPSGKQAVVVMPLEQFNQMAATAGSSATPNTSR